MEREPREPELKSIEINPGDNIFEAIRDIQEAIKLSESEQLEFRLVKDGQTFEFNAEEFSKLAGETMLRVLDAFLSGREV